MSGRAARRRATGHGPASERAVGRFCTRVRVGTPRSPGLTPAPMGLGTVTRLLRDGNDQGQNRRVRCEPVPPNVSVRLPEGFLETIDEFAGSEGRTRAEMLRLVIREGIELHQAQAAGLVPAWR